MRSLHLLSLTLLAGVLVAQYNRSTISGSVIDSSGALVPGARVKIAAPLIGLERTTETGDAGYFTVPGLPPGVYNILVEKAGFKASSRSELKLDPNATLDVSFSLTVGDVTERVDVTSEAPQVETGNGEIARMLS